MTHRNHDIIVIDPQFRGPPDSGNGGYVCGMLGQRVGGVATWIVAPPGTAGAA
ncbi:MAG TPA: hypothetical protein PKZ76_04115 [Xanthomonadaceae bacterium]|nr:hypothetical protein [Xanthomonadaceae bacterium]